MQERAPELLGDCSRNPLLLWSLHATTDSHPQSAESTSHLRFPMILNIIPLTRLLDLLLSGIPTKILHKSLIYSSHTTGFAHLIFLI